MTFPAAALTTEQYTMLRGAGTDVTNWLGKLRVSVVPNTVVWASTVLTTPNPGAPYAEIEYDSALEGDEADVQLDQTILIGEIDDIRKATFVERVRAVPDGTVVGVGETSATIQAGWFIWVIDDYRIHAKKLRLVTSGGVIVARCNDWNKTFAALPPFCKGLQTFYGGFVDPDSAYLRLSLSITAQAATSGASISSYLVTLPAGTVLISGSLSSAACVVDIPAGPPVWCHWLITDSGGRTLKRHFVIHAAEPTGANAPFYGFDSASVRADVLGGGYTASIVGFEGIQNVLDNSFIAFWTDEDYQGEHGSLFAGTNDPKNVNWVGRIRTENARAFNADQDRPNLMTETGFALESAQAQLARTYGPSITMQHKNSGAAQLDEIVNLTVQRAIVYVLGTDFSTFLNLHDLDFFDFDTVFVSKYFTTQGRNLLQIVNQIAASVNSQMEFSPYGGSQFPINESLLELDDRDALPVIGNWTVSDALADDFRIEVQDVELVGRVDASGEFYNTASDYTDALMSVAPGHAQTNAEGAQALTQQTLAANQTHAAGQDELDWRGGRTLGQANLKYRISSKHPGNYHPFVPSRRAWYTWTLGASTNNRGLAFDTSTRWILTAVEWRHDNRTSTREVSHEYQCETFGDKGEKVDPPAPGQETPDTSFDLPTFDPYPTFTDFMLDPIPDGGESPYTGEPPFSPVAEPPRDGNTLIFWDAGNIWLTLNALAPVPTYRSITPQDVVDNGYTIVKCQWDLRFNKRLYVLANDGADSFVYSAVDGFANPPSYSRGASRTGIYTVLRVGPPLGTVRMYNPSTAFVPPEDADCSPAFYDFTLSTEPFVVASGSFEGGVGLHEVYDGFEDIIGVVLECTDHMASGAYVRVKMFKNEYPVAYHRINYYDADDNFIFGSAPAFTFTDNAINTIDYDTNIYGTSIYKWDWLLYGFGFSGTSPSYILKSIEIINP